MNGKTLALRSPKPTHNVIQFSVLKRGVRTFKEWGTKSGDRLYGEQRKTRKRSGNERDRAKGKRGGYTTITTMCLVVTIS